MNDSKISNVDKNLDNEFQSLKSKNELNKTDNFRPSGQNQIPSKTISGPIKSTGLNTNVHKKEKPNSTTKMTKYGGRDEKVDPDIYYNVKQENEHLKLHQYKLNEEIKRYNIFSLLIID